MKYYATAFLVAVCVTGVSFTSVRAQSTNEQNPVFQASDLLPNDVLVGPNYSVTEAVKNNGYLNVYSVTVNGDSYEVVGNAAMEIRLAELAALQKMEALKKTDVYKKALTTALASPFGFAKDLITSPIDTVKGIASGVKTLFGSVGHALFGGASDQEEGVAKTALGFDVAKRQFAFKFGIDPYTSFPPVRDRLDEISWTGVAGNLTVGGAFQALPSTTKKILSGTKAAGGLNKLVRDNTPAELKKVNEKTLKAMRVPDGIAELFLEHPKYSPTEKTILVESLARVGIHNREAFIKRAILVQDEEMAFFMRRWSQMIAAYHTKVAPAERIVMLGKMPLLQRADGVVVAVLPIDHVAWTEDVAGRHAANMAEIKAVSGITGGELWLEGTISAHGRQALEAQNWIIKENVGTLLGLN